MVIPSAAAEEELARKFLDEIRARGFFDMAIAHLDRIDSSPLASPEFRETLLYEQGVTLVQSAVQQRDYQLREDQLSEANEKFRQFIEQHGSHALAAAAGLQRGKIQIERAQLRRARAEAPSLPESESKRLLSQALALLDEARLIFEANESLLRKRLEQIPRNLDSSKDPKLFQERSQLRSDYVLAKFLSSLVQYEKGLLLPAESDERDKLLDDAFKRFAEVADKYRRRIWGVESVYYQGLCQQYLDKPKEALGFFMELLEQDTSDPDLRRVRTKALAQAIECWLHDDVKNYDAAIEQGKAWLEEERPNEQRAFEWVSLKLALAKAFQAKAKTESGQKRQELEAECRRLANRAASVPSPLQDQAQALVIAAGQVAEQVADAPVPTSFPEAAEAARKIRERHQVASATVQLVGARLSDVSDASQRQELQAKIDEATIQQRQLRSAEIDLLRACLALADEGEVSVEELNDVRFQLCYYYYLLDDDFRASALGEFLATRYPDSPGSRQAARIALASLVRLHSGDQQLAPKLIPRIQKLAEFILTRWAGSDEAEVALQALISFSIQSRNFEQAEKYLALIPADSPKLGDAELMTGQAIWVEYLKLRQQNAASQQPESDQLAKLKDRALSLLNRGVEHKRSGAATPSLIYALLAQARSLIEAEQFERAAQLLDDEKTGPHRLAQQGNPIVNGKGIREQAYSLAIQAYAGLSAQSPNPESLIRRAMESLDDLRGLVEGSPEGSRAMANEYVNLASQLQARIESASPEAKAAITRGFELLLERVAQTATDQQVLMWAAESFAKLGRASADPTGKLDSGGKRLVGQALAIYEKLLGRKDLDDETRKVLQLRGALTLRDLQQFEKSISALIELLSRNETQVYIQVETARTFQMWGDSGIKEAYVKAIAGDRMIPATRQNLAWGWGKLGQLLGRDPKFRELFYDARYNLALCRFRYAMMLPKPDRMKTLKMAENDVVFTARLYPDLGGEQSTKRFDQLLKQVQHAQGEQPVGIKNK
jgi:hypothetical protein